MAEVPKRVKHFAWKIRHNTVATRQNMLARKISKDAMCPIFESSEETIEHLFLLCPWTAPIWFGLQISLVPTVITTSNIYLWLDRFLEGDSASNPDLGTYLSNAITALWYIWKARNLKIFEYTNPNPYEVMFSIKHVSPEYIYRLNLPK